MRIQAVVISAAFALACIAGLAVSPPSYAGCGEVFQAAPKASAEPGGPPLAVGDSVLAGAVPDLVKLGFEANGVVCRQMSAGIQYLRERGTRLPRVVVLALGTNGEVTGAQIAEAVSILGPDRMLGLVTPYHGVDPSDGAIIRTAAASDSHKVFLIDWAAMARSHPSWLAPDGVHLGGEEGYAAFAALIARTAREASGPGAPSYEGSGESSKGPETLTVPEPANKQAAASKKSVRTPARQSPTLVRRNGPKPRMNEGDGISPALWILLGAALAGSAVTVARRRKPRATADDSGSG